MVHGNPFFRQPCIKQIQNEPSIGKGRNYRLVQEGQAEQATPMFSASAKPVSLRGASRKHRAEFAG